MEINDEDRHVYISCLIQSALRRIDTTKKPEDIPNIKILDVGAGDSPIFLAKLHEHDMSTVTRLDIDGGELTSVDELVAHKNSFDGVVFSYSIGQILRSLFVKRTDPVDYFNKINASLKEGAVVIVCYPTTTRINYEFNPQFGFQEVDSRVREFQPCLPLLLKWFRKKVQVYRDFSLPSQVNDSRMILVLLA
jgi:hypothetical protein